MSMWTEHEQYSSVLHNKNSLRNGGKEIQALQGTGTLLLMGSTDQKNKNTKVVHMLWLSANFGNSFACLVVVWNDGI